MIFIFCLWSKLKELQSIKTFQSLRFPIRLRIQFSMECNSLNITDWSLLHITNFVGNQKFYKLGHMHFLPTIKTEGATEI